MIKKHKQYISQNYKVKRVIKGGELMLQLTLFEKLKVLFDLILGSPFFIFLFIFTILIFIILLDSKNYKRKKIKRYIFGIYLLVFIAVIIKYHSSFLSILDYLINNVFVIFYFPNIAVYAFMIIIINIVMLKSLFSNKDKLLRVINIAFYSIIMYFMLLIIYTITTEQLNVYDQISLYSNQNTLVLVELSNILFVVWMVLILINKLLNFFETKGIRIKSRFISTSDDNIKIEYVEKEIIKEVPVIKEVIKEVPVEKIIYKDKPEEMYTKEEYTFSKEEYLMLLKILKSKED